MILLSGMTSHLPFTIIIKKYHTNDTHRHVILTTVQSRNTGFEEIRMIHPLLSKSKDKD